MSSRTTADDLASSAVEKTQRRFRVVLDDHPDLREGTHPDTTLLSAVSRALWFSKGRSFGFMPH